MHKVLVITGGSKGIGKATVDSFLENKYQVINVSRSPLKKDGVINIEFNLLENEKIPSLCDKIIALLKMPCQLTLIHNASLVIKDSVAKVDLSSLDALIKLNVLAPAILNEKLIPVMASGSSILYVGSTLSEKAVKGAFSYISVKHAVAGMMKASTQDLAGKEIHSACICPGFTDTEMLREYVGNDELKLKGIETRVAHKRLIKPKEIADLLLFAAQNPVINGSVLHANLGQIET